MRGKPTLNGYNPIKTTSDASIRRFRVKGDKGTHALTLIPLVNVEQRNRQGQKRVSNLVNRCMKYRQINHKNVEEIADVYIAKERTVAWMGIVGQIGGYDLHDFTGDQLHKDPSKLKQLMLDITEGLEALHQRNIIYQNWGFGSIQRNVHDLHYKLRFGSFREINNFRRREQSNQPNQYTAPEQYRREGYDCSADVWALGVLFTEIISGEEIIYPDQHNMKGRDRQQSFYQKITSKEYLSKLPNGGVRDLVTQMIRQDSQQRLSIGSVRQRLQRIDLNECNDSQEEEIVQKQDEYIPLSINLIPFTFKHSKRQDQQRKVIRKFSFNHLKVVFELNTQKTLLTIETKGEDSSKISIKTHYCYSELPLSYQMRFDSLSQLCEKLKNVRNDKVELKSSGQLKISFIQEDLLPYQQSQAEIQAQAQAQVYASSYKQPADVFSLKQETPRTTAQAFDLTQKRKSFESSQHNLLSQQKKRPVNKKHGHTHTHCRCGFPHTEDQIQLNYFQKSMREAADNGSYDDALYFYEQFISKYQLVHPERGGIMLWPTRVNMISTCLQAQKYQKCFDYCLSLYTQIERAVTDLGEAIVREQLADQYDPVISSLTYSSFQALYNLQKQTYQWRCKLSKIANLEVFVSYQRAYLLHMIYTCKHGQNQQDKEQYLLLELYYILATYDHSQQYFIKDCINVAIDLFNIDPFGYTKQCLKMFEMALKKIKSYGWREGSYSSDYQRVVNNLLVLSMSIKQQQIPEQIRGFYKWIRINIPEKADLFIEQ